MQLRHVINLFTIIALTAILFTGPAVPTVQAGVDDVLFGVVSSQEMVDFSAINASNFAQTFTYSGDMASSLTIGGQVEAQIGAIYTGDGSEEWHQIRVVIDSNADGSLTPFDWSDPDHPWNPDIENPSNGYKWQYTYDDDYPRPELQGDTIWVTWNSSCYCTDFPWNTWEQWWYEGSADKTDNWWMESGQLMNIWWSGRDQNWNTLPNGDYKVQVWVDEDDDGQFGADEAHKTMIITVQTAGITGTVKDESGNPVVGARVEAGSWLAWGETRTSSTGTFTVSGLQAGADYHVRVQSTGKVTYETDVQLPDGETSASAGTLTLSDAITISGTINLDRDADGDTDEDDKFAAFTNQWGWEQNDLWIWVDGHNTQGPGWGNTDARFEVDDSSISFSINIPPPASDTNYRLNVHTEGYVATINGQPVSGVDIPVTSSGGNAGTIVLTKASRLSGTVLLPEAVEWSHIDVQAVSMADSDERYWGWGSIDPWRDGGDGSPTDTGEFAIDGIPAGTYRLEVRVMGYAANISDNVAVTRGQNKDMGQLTISEGSKITGTLTIGDTTNLQRWSGDNNTDLDIWIDAWSRSGGWSGTSVRITRGPAQQVSYSLAGLSNATYEINCWLGEGYELVDGSGQSPVMVTVSGQTTANLQLKAHEGVVQGTLSGNGVSIDPNKVVVEVKRPWDWLPPKMATVANGGINAATGTYRVSGLGTGDYVVKAGLYSGFMGDSGQNTDLSQYQGNANLIPDSSVGVSMQRTFVQNNAANPTTLNLIFERGYSITGTVALSQVDPPWHDFGDGVYDSGTQSFGDPDGRKNTNADGLLSEEIGMVEDIAGQPVMAMPMDMMFMGGQDPRMGFIEYDNGTGLATYHIDGLAPGVYMLQPPFNSERITRYTDDGSGDNFHGPQGDQSAHHWTATTLMVVITDRDVTGQDFTFANGYTVTGQLTLPEAQTYSEDWEAWNWVGQLEIETPQHQFMGHGRPLMKRDFSQGSRYSFTFNHVANGDYLVRFWTDRFVPGGTKFTVNNANSSVNLSIEAGANLVGKLVDADTGEAVTASDGVMVRCEAIPHVEGSWRETRDDMWSQSYIEDGGDLESSGPGESTTGDGNSRTNNTPGKFHLTALPTGHKYIVVVETTNGKKTDGAKNYVGQVIAGIEIPEGASGDINIGTIKLTEGTTIKGRLTDANGNGIPGVDVIAMPSNTHDGSAEAEGVSDTQGYFTIYGINPDVAYYDLIAAERPDMFEDWGKQVQWGEKRKYNVTPNTTDADFVLTPATASLSGTLSIPSGSRFMIPFKDEANDFPATIIMLQRKGVIYKDVLDGIEVMSTPAPEGATTTTYTIDHIAPGKFKAIFMNYGLPTKIVDNIEITDGGNTLNMSWNSAGYTVSGDVALADGGYPSTADINGVICMNIGDQSLIFGQLTQEADDTYSGYEVPGLASGNTYQLVFFRESGFDGPPEIYTTGSPFTVSGNIADNTAIITRNSVPVLMAQAVLNPSSGVVSIGIFSTAYLNDDSITVVGAVPTAASTAGEIYMSSGAGSLSNIILSGDKRSISVSYTKSSADTTVTLTLAVHYGDDDTTFLQNLSFNVNSLAKNEDSVSIYIPGQVKLGNGDASQIYVPAGALDTSDDGAAIVSIEKSDEVPGTLAGASQAAALSRGIFARSATVALPEDSTAAGNQYEFNISAAGSGASVTQNGTVIVQIQYDPDLSDAEIEKLQVKHLVNGQWVTETTNRTVDTDNHTISVEVSSLSPFIAAVVQSDSDDSDGDDSGGDSGTDSGTSSGGGSSGGCFISSGTPASDIGDGLLLTGFSLLAMMLGLGLALHSTITRFKKES